ncbi:MAG: hypothetical protein LIV25_00120 [Olsenella sp.]|jgi:hypothetical protein|nr:hypothetical protein [Olsenella sp.]
MDKSDAREIDEAIAAGEDALASLEEARRTLKSASNWGLADIFGGGFITTAIKHSRIDDARDQIEQARRDLVRFSSELRDVRNLNLPDIDIDIDGFLSLADYLFDGAIADVLVQSRIQDALDQVNVAKARVEEIVATLKERRR